MPAERRPSAEPPTKVPLANYRRFRQQPTLEIVFLRNTIKGRNHCLPASLRRSAGEPDTRFHLSHFFSPGSPVARSISNRGNSSSTLSFKAIAGLPRWEKLSMNPTRSSAATMTTKPSSLCAFSTKQTPRPAMPPIETSNTGHAREGIGGVPSEKPSGMLRMT
jgi:hypothetical protein